MRTINELLVLLLGEIEKEKEISKYSGLCLIASYMVINEIITPDEEYMIDLYIFKNKPAANIDGYGWKPYQWAWRIKWIKKHIELTK